MLEPATRNFPGESPNLAERVADKAAEKAQIVADIASEKAQLVADIASEKAQSAVLAAEQLRDRLYERWQRINHFVVNEAERLPQFGQELRDDADYIVDRARYYHETRPLNALGMAAAGAFVLGMVIGFGRH